MPISKSSDTVTQGAAGADPWLIEVDQLPAAAVLPDPLPNPTTTVVAACLYVKSGSQWVPYTGGGGSLADVNITQIAGASVPTGHGTAAGAMRVELPSDGTGVVTANQGGGAWTVTATNLDIRDLNNASDSVAAHQAGTWLMPCSQSGTWDVGITGNPAVVGAAAHGAAVSGAPLLVGAEGRTSDPTAVDSGDAVRALADVFGKRVVLLGSIPELRVSGRVNLTNTTASDVVSAAGAGRKIVVTSVVVTNASGTTASKVEIRDGTTVKAVIYCDVNGGGASLHDPAGLFVGTANTAVTARCATTGADVEVFVSGHTIGN